MLNIINIYSPDFSLTPNKKNVQDRWKHILERNNSLISDCKEDILQMVKK